MTKTLYLRQLFEEAVANVYYDPDREYVSNGIPTLHGDSEDIINAWESALEQAKIFIPDSAIIEVEVNDDAEIESQWDHDFDEPEFDPELDEFDEFDEPDEPDDPCV